MVPVPLRAALSGVADKAQSVNFGAFAILLDNYVYLVHKFGHIDELHGLSRYWVRTYDLLFNVPFTRKYLHPDGVRSVDFEFQEIIDEKLVQILREDEVSHYDRKVMSETVQIILDYQRTHVGPLQRRIPGI